MIAIWSTANVTIDWASLPGCEDMFESMPLRNEPPKGCPSVYLNPGHDFDFDFPFAALFQSDDYFDLAFPASDRNVKDFLKSIGDWPDFPFWIAIRDTPQTRWLRRLKEITGHLGNAILQLMERKGIVIRIV